MKVVSLFDGIAGARQALKNLNIKCEYHALEIDKHAITVAKSNHPDIKHHGSVVDFPFDWFDDVDLLVGGSPCQGFSFAGKQLNFNDPRSKLFFEFVRALKEMKPKYFLLENVVMKKEYQDVISKELGVAPIEINSRLLTAQNRRRLYWTNIPDIEQPRDRNILIGDIGIDGIVGRMVGRRINERGVRDDYNKSIKPIQRFEPRTDRKTGTLTTVAKDNMVYKNCKNIYPLQVSFYEKLQGFPVGYTDCIPYTQRYKALGNSFTVPVIEHILGRITN